MSITIGALTPLIFAFKENSPLSLRAISTARTGLGFTASSVMRISAPFTLANATGLDIESRKPTADTTRATIMSPRIMRHLRR